MKKILISLCLVMGMMLPASPSYARQNPTKQPKKILVMSWKFYHRLAKCETGDNLNHSTLSYTSMFGIYRRTFQQYSNHSSAKNMDFWQQAKVVDNIAWLGHTENGEYKWPVGPWGWGAVKQNCMGLQHFICQSKHPKVQRWKRRC